MGRNFTDNNMKTFTFPELSEPSKSKARDYFRSFVDEHWDDSSKFLAEIAELLGIHMDLDSVSFRGFGSQSDRFTFRGYLYLSEMAHAETNIANDFPRDDKLAQLAKTAKDIFDHSTVIRVKRKLLGEYDIETDKIFTRQLRGFPTYVDEWDEAFDPLEKELNKFIAAFSHWAYKNLEEEYEYFNSDEVIEENILANNYKFDEHGGIV